MHGSRAGEQQVWHDYQYLAQTMTYGEMSSMTSWMSPIMGMGHSSLALLQVLEAT